MFVRNSMTYPPAMIMLNSTRTHGRYIACNKYTHMYSHNIHTLNGLFSRTTWVSRHQKGKPFWILLKQEMMGGWTMQTICTTLQTDHHASTPSLNFMGWMPFLTPNQQCQSTEGKCIVINSPNSPKPPMSYKDGISKHRLVPYNTYCLK